MRRIALALWVVLFPIAAAAQQVVVRGGEHGEFTRLVFDIPAGAQWDLSEPNEEKTVRLSVSGGARSFNTSSTFDKIDRSRVTALEPVEGEAAIDILLACECETTSFVLRDRMLVLDVREAAVNEEDIAEASAPQTAPAPRLAIEPLENNPLARDLSVLRIDGMPGIGPERQAAPLIPSVSILRPAGSERQASELPPEIDPFVVGGDIAADIARAATTGLLDPALRAAPDPMNPNMPGSSMRSDMAEGGGVDAVQTMASELARVTHNSVTKGVISIGGESCEPDKSLRLANWVGDETILDVLGSDRSGLFGEFDKVDQRAVRSYARSLLYFGFGAEARNVLQIDAEVQSNLLNSLSYLVDGEMDPTGWFVKQAYCDGYAAFWSAMSGGVKKEDTDYNSPAILRGFESLPAHLRDHLGPLLAERLSEAGKTDLARDVLRRLARLHGGATDSLTLSSAQIDLLEGNYADAEQALNSIGSLPESAAPAAITAAVQIAHATDKPVPQEMVELTAAYASELRDSEEGPNLWKSLVRSQMLNGKYTESMEVLRDSEGISTEMIHGMSREVFASLTQNASDIEFLKFAMNGKMETKDLDAPALDLAIARRMVDLSLPDVALARLEALPDMPGAQEFRVVRAQALLALSRPEEAEIALIGLRGNDVSRLRAEARRQMGDHDYAGNLYQEIGETEEALNSAWLSGDWERVAAEDESPLAQAARLMADTSVAPDEPNLGYAEDLAGQSIETRETLRALLDATRITPDN